MASHLSLKTPPAAHADVVRHLNVALRYALTAINQHFLHARMLKHQGRLPLADREYKDSLDTMRHADRIVERILGLGGLPNLQELGKLSIGHTPQEMLRCNLQLERQAKADLEDAITACAAAGDGASGALLSGICAEARGRIEFLCQQLDAMAEA